MSIEEILKSVEESNYKTATEALNVNVGLKDNLEIAPILEKYAWLYELPVVEFMRGEYEKENDIDRKEQLRRLYFDLAGTFLYKKIAVLNDKIETFFSRAEAEVDGEKIPFHNLRPLTMKTENFDKRERLHDAYVSVIKDVNPDFLKMLEVEVEAAKKDLGFGGYVDFFQKSKTIDYGEFYKTVTDATLKLNGFYREKMKPFAENKLSRPWENMKSCHGTYLLAFNYFDKYFPKEKLLSAFRASMNDLGFDVLKQANIQIDAENRPKKNPRASCFSNIVPDEIHLIIKPLGGYHDYESFFHEAGHAEHFANVDANLPYVYRHLATSHALTELFSYLFESFTRNPSWLMKYLDSPPDVARQIQRDTELGNLFMLIRYLAKFSYEYEFFSASSFDGSGKLYANTLTGFTNFVYDPALFLHDMDGGFYSADYLRAWLGRAQLVDYFEKQFGEEWFAKKETGDWLKNIWRDGSRYELENRISGLGVGKPFDTSALVSSFQKFLA